LKYLSAVKALGRLVVVAAGAVLLAMVLVAGASARTRAHRRHVEFFPPSSRASMYLGERDGYDIGVSFAEPDLAILQVSAYDDETGDFTSTNYGAHFQGSLPLGHLRADFGSVGSVSVHFRPRGKARTRGPGANCSGRPSRDEAGYFVGRVSLHGEGGYFRIAENRADGSLQRSFRSRCWVKRHQRIYPPPSLREAVVPRATIPFGGGNGGSLASLQVVVNEDRRQIELRVDHFAGSSSGGDVQLGEREYQGKMPVGRGISIEDAPAGTFLTTLPGEHPPTATLQPPAPFSGEAEYVGTSPTSHSWTGSLAVQLPGQLLALTGPEFASSLCVVRALGSRFGCDFSLPNWQLGEE
jgi:hypothetical protein